MKKDVIFANALAVCNEMKLLGREQLLRLTAAGGHKEALKMLYDHGYTRAGSDDIDGVIAAQVDALNEFAREECPDGNLLSVLLCPYYYSNAKLYYKAKRAGTDGADAAVYGLDDGNIKTAVESGDYTGLSAEMRGALQAADAHGEAVTSRQIDIEADAAMYRETLRHAKRSLRLELVRFVRHKIDLNNFLTFLRCRALGRDWDFCREMLIEGGSVDLAELAAAYPESDEAAAERLEGNTLYDAFYAMMKGTINPDLGIDAFLAREVTKNAAAYTSFLPFLSYYYRQLSEYRVVQMILIMLKNGMADGIEKRLRGLYD